MGILFIRSPAAQTPLRKYSPWRLCSSLCWPSAPLLSLRKKWPTRKLMSSSRLPSVTAILTEALPTSPPPPLTSPPPSNTSLPPQPPVHVRYAAGLPAYNYGAYPYTAGAYPYAAGVYPSTYIRSAAIAPTTYVAGAYPYAYNYGYPYATVAVAEKKE